MLFSSLRRLLNPISRAAKTRRKTPSRKPWMEFLESRTVPSVSAQLYNQIPLSFEPNLGQSNPQVQFLARGTGYGLYLTSNEAVLSLGKSASSQAGDIVHLQLIGANASPNVTGLEQLEGRTNYFVGNDPSQWRTNIPNYAKVEYQSIYPGINLVYYGNQRQLEYDFVVMPGASPKEIALNVQGVNGLQIDGQGNLILQAAGGDVLEHAPHIYQVINGVQQTVVGRFVLQGEHQVGFQVEAYDSSKPLTIDPVLSYSTYLGGSGFDQGHAIAIDSVGNAYLTGSTSSVDFPTTPGAYQTSYSDPSIISTPDVFVTKLNAAGNAIVYSTYLGGSATDIGFGIAVDAQGDAIVVGNTGSGGLTSSLLPGFMNFPTVNAFQSSSSGAGDGFVSKLSPGGDHLVYSSYLGGGGSTFVRAVAVDSAGNAYLTGETAPNASALFPEPFPTTPGAFQSSASATPSLYAFVTKVGPTGTMAYSTLLGGGGYDGGRGIAVDQAGNAYVTGVTSSGSLGDSLGMNVLNPPFPTTANAFQPAIAPSPLYYPPFGPPQYVVNTFDAFVTEVNATGSGLIYSTYLGGGQSNNNTGAFDEGHAIALDGLGNIYVTGGTNSTSFPTSAGAFQTTYGGLSGQGGQPASDAFVAKIDPRQSGAASLVYSTYLGGNDFDQGNGISVDSQGNAYIVGTTHGGIPVQNPLTPGNIVGAFVTEINPTASALVYSTPLLGTDTGEGIALDSSGSAYIVGSTASPFMPTLSAAQSTYGGNTDAFVAKLANASSSILVNFDTVFVDDNWVGQPAGATVYFPGDPVPRTIGGNAFATIQQGIQGVANNGVVRVAAGLYVENVAVNRPVELVGAGQGLSVIEPATSGPNPGPTGSLPPGSSNVILVQANDIKIHDFTVEGDNPLLNSSVNVGGANIDARNGIVTDHRLGTFNNLEVYNTTVRDIYLRGIYASSGGTFNFHDNTVSNVQGDPYGQSIGIFDFGGAGSMTHNTVSDTSAALAANWSEGVQFLNNIISSSGTGIHTDNPGGNGGGTNDLIQGNVITNGQPGGYGIFSFVPYNTVTIRGNTISGVDVGLAAFGGQGGTTQFMANDVSTAPIDPVNNPDGLGAVVSTDQLGYYTGSVSASFSDNVIHDTRVGLYIEQPQDPHTPGSITTLTVTANTIRNASCAGVEMIGGTATLTQNSFQNNGAGILVEGGHLALATQNFVNGSTGDAFKVTSRTGAFLYYGIYYGTPGNVTTTGNVGTIFDNDLSGNSGFGVSNSTAAAVDASGNWWGSNMASGVAAKAYGTVSFTRWLGTGEDTDPATPGFQGRFIYATATPVTTAVYGTVFSGEVASFTDANPGASISNFPLANVTIHWGDGGTSGATDIQLDSAGTFHVFGSYAYTAAGIKLITVTIRDVGGAVSNTTNYAATVAKADATINVMPYSVTYNGDAHTATGTVIGVHGETLSGLDLNGTTHSNAGTFTDSWTFTDTTGNYNNASGTVSDSIAKANATIHIQNYTGVYDGNAHGLSGTAAGVKGENLSTLLNLGAQFSNADHYDVNWSFAASNNYQAASGTGTVDISKAATTIVVVSSLNPSAPNQAVTFTATVSASIATPGGTVTFLDGNTILGSAVLDNAGHASFTSPAFALAVGDHSITVSYNGNGNYSASTSQTLVQHVLTAQQQILVLVNKVNTLVATGVLNNGNGNALTTKLYGAISSLDAGDKKTGVNQLNAFINQVKAFKNAGKLSSTQAQDLIEVALVAIASI